MNHDPFGHCTYYFEVNYILLILIKFILMKILIRNTIKQSSNNLHARYKKITFLKVLLTLFKEH